VDRDQGKIAARPVAVAEREQAGDVEEPPVDAVPIDEPGRVGGNDVVVAREPVVLEHHLGAAAGGPDGHCVAAQGHAVAGDQGDGPRARRSHSCVGRCGLWGTACRQHQHERDCETTDQRQTKTTVHSSTPSARLTPTDAREHKARGGAAPTYG
jgi:hypothetical protein